MDRDNCLTLTNGGQRTAVRARLIFHRECRQRCASAVGFFHSPACGLRCSTAVAYIDTLAIAARLTNESVPSPFRHSRYPYGQSRSLIILQQIPHLAR